MFPVAPVTGGLPSAFPSLPKKSLMIAPEDVAAHRKAWVDEWLAAMSE
jgi:thiamine transport system substrate-binding protein